MLHSPFTAEELTRYAEVVIDACLDMRPGELLQLSYQHEHRPLGVAMAVAAYRRGLRVEATVSDPLIVRAELDHADEALLGVLSPWQVARMRARTDGAGAVAFILGEGDPDALAGTDPRRMAVRARRWREHTAEVLERVAANRDSSVILAYPSAGWAARVYPELEPERAQRALAEDLLAFCRIGPGDGPGGEALGRHIAALRERAAAANRLGLRELRFRGPGTDLRVGLAGDGRWSCSGETNAFGRDLFLNLPSEEIYTSPAASATEGTVRCTAPLAYDGVVYEDLRMEFQAGRLVRLHAATDEQRDRLLGLLDVDEGGRRLGEVALVDASSRIGRRGRLYWNTLLDENQACHMALGFGFAACRRDGTASADLNTSRTHIDVMIGAPDVEVTGTTDRGDVVPLITDGVWRPS